MANYPSRPWTNNQTAELYPGVTFRYNAANKLWSQEEAVRTASDSDAFEARYNADKGNLQSRITALESNPSGDMDSEQVMNVVSGMNFDFETY